MVGTAVTSGLCGGGQPTGFSFAADFSVLSWIGFNFSFRVGMVCNVQRREIHRTALLRLIVDCCLGVTALGAAQPGKLAAVRPALDGLAGPGPAFHTHR